MRLIKKGFTLVELLVVIGVLAVLMAGVIATINPLEKRRQAMDAQSQSYVAQVASALQAAAAVDEEGLYPAALADLVTDGELAALPPLPADATENASGLGTEGPVCVWVNMLAQRNIDIGACWVWCSNTGSSLQACP